MNKKMRAALAGLAFVAGCEIGIAIQLMKMIHKFTIREGASNVDADYPEDAEIDEAVDEIDEGTDEIAAAADEVDEAAGGINEAADEITEAVDEVDEPAEEPAEQVDDETVKADEAPC